MVNWTVTSDGNAITPIDAASGQEIIQPSGTKSPPDFQILIPAAGTTYLTSSRPPVSFTLNAWLTDPSFNYVGIPTQQQVTQNKFGWLRQEYADHPLKPVAAEFKRVPDVSSFINTVDDQPSLDYLNFGDYDWAIIPSWLPTTYVKVRNAVQAAGLPINLSPPFQANGAPAFLGSAYRNPVHEWNDGASKGGSQHLWGAALDLQVLTKDKTTINRTAADYYRYSPYAAPYGELIWEPRPLPPPSYKHVHVQKVSVGTTPSVGSVTTKPSTSVTAGQNVVIIIMLHEPCSPASSPLSVSLSSSNPAIPIPAGTTVQFQPGRGGPQDPQPVTFTVQAQEPSSGTATSVTITAWVTGTTVKSTGASRTITVNP